MSKRFVSLFVLAILLSAQPLFAYSVRFLDNAEFTSNCDYWLAAYAPIDYGTPGTAAWSSSYGGSCYLTVSGGPSVIDLIQFTKTTIYPGDTVKADIPHTNMSGYGSVALYIGGWGSEFGQELAYGDGTRYFNIVADKIYTPNTAIMVHLVVWPGSGEAWVNYIRLGRAGTITGVAEYSNNETSTNMPVVKPVLNNSFPNPTKNFTTIEYSIPNNGLVKLNIYNTLGQLVKTAVNEAKRAGNYKYTWNGLNNDGQKIASGTYLYSLEVDGKATTKKMIVIK